MHAVSARFELQPGIGPVAFYPTDDLPEAAVLAFACGQDLQIPALFLGIALIHPEQVAGKNCGFVAARAGADLEEYIVVVMWIPGHEMGHQFPFELLDYGRGILEFLPAQLAQFRIAAFRHLRRCSFVMSGFLESAEQLRNRFQPRIFT